MGMMDVECLRIQVLPQNCQSGAQRRTVNTSRVTGIKAGPCGPTRKEGVPDPVVVRCPVRH